MRASRWYDRGASLLFGVLLALVVLEASLRLMGAIFLYLRAPAAIPTIADNRAIRVLCLGESTTADMLFLGAESYPAQLEHMLNAQAGAHFAIINGGVPATTTTAILHDLPGTIAKARPDIVVTMMGINDGPTIDPVFQVSREHGGLRILKLARMLYILARTSGASTGGSGWERTPDQLSMSAQLAWRQALDGQLSEARATLAPMLTDDAPPGLRLLAFGIEAVVEWSDGHRSDGDRAQATFLSLRDRMPTEVTAANYRQLATFLASHRIPLIAVQYPAIPIAPLRAMLEDQADVVFVDNEATFIDALRLGHPDALFRDLFGGLFGHMTPRANGMLAANVARALQALTRPPP